MCGVAQGWVAACLTREHVTLPSSRDLCPARSANIHAVRTGYGWTSIAFSVRLIAVPAASSLSKMQILRTAAVSAFSLLAPIDDFDLNEVQGQ
jgi:hypothetical protein